MKLIPELHISEKRQKYLNQVYNKWVDEKVRSYIKENIEARKKKQGT